MPYALVYNGKNVLKIFFEFPCYFFSYNIFHESSLKKEEIKGTEKRAKVFFDRCQMLFFIQVKSCNLEPTFNLTLKPYILGDSQMADKNRSFVDFNQSNFFI